MQSLGQTRPRDPRRPDATYRRLLREQRWWERRQRLRFEVRNHWEERPRLELRRHWDERPPLELRRRWHERSRLELRRRWDERSRLELRRRWHERPRLEVRRRWHPRPRLPWRVGPAARRIAIVTPVLLLGGVAGHGHEATGGPWAMGMSQSAQDGSRGGPPSRQALGPAKPGILVSVTVDDRGGLAAVERGRVAEPITELSLVPPPPPPGSRRLPQLQDVRLLADGEPVSVADTVEVTTVVLLPRPASRFEVRYRIVRATARSKPPARSKPTDHVRATLSLRPALVPTVEAAPAVIEVRGTRVHNLVCVDRPQKKQLCGVDRKDGWRTRRIPVASSAVIALVDLPRRAA